MSSWKKTKAFFCWLVAAVNLNRYFLSSSFLRSFPHKMVNDRRKFFQKKIPRIDQVALRPKRSFRWYLSPFVVILNRLVSKYIIPMLYQGRGHVCINLKLEGVCLEKLYCASTILAVVLFYFR